ncbi:MAG: hypothetical protein M1821_004409 [Bathelium mastoideum]|nr:MAG: hypothetical protein M1821_004409 [Bathelium mastoideum]
MSSSSRREPNQSDLQIIKTKRLVLRRACPTDAEYLLPILSHPEAMQWLSLSAGLRRTVEEAEDWLHERLARPRNDSFLVGLISAAGAATLDDQVGKELKSTEWETLDEVIGVIGCSSTPRIGYIFHPNYYGKGYATEALQVYMDSYWSRVPSVSSGKAGSFDYARAETAAENLPSRRLLEKCGFVFQYIVGERINDESYGDFFKGGFREDAFYLIARPGTDVNLAGIPYGHS